MNRIERMVAEMCPEGVEKRPLGEFVRVETQAVSPASMGDGTINLYSLPSFDRNLGPEATRSMSVKSAKTRIVSPCVLVSKLNPHIVRVWDVPIVDGESYCSTEFVQLVPLSGMIDRRFLYFIAICAEEMLGGSVSGSTNSHKRLHRGDFLSFRVQVPPIEIQQEIVDILDSFTRLEAELEAELEARKVQYSYLRSSILDFEKGLGAHLIEEANADVRRLSLGDVLEPRFGKRITRSANLGSIYPVFGGGGESFRTDLWNREDDVVISRFAMSENCVRKVSGRFWLLDSGFTFDVVDSNCFDKSFVAQFLLANQSRIFGASTKSAQKNIKIPLFLNIPIDVPPIGVQRRIADVLDDFDALVNDLSSGLPAEIAARRQQYEYYRDRLLTFPEKK